MAGYVISNMAAAKLTLTIEGGHSDHNLAPPPPGTHIIGNIVTIEDAITNYMATETPKLEGTVAVTFTGTADSLETIIITQGCSLKRRDLDRPPPVAIEGKWEERVRQWLHKNGNIPLLRMPLHYAHTLPIGVSEQECKWDVREDYSDQDY
jgi:hypothetical protein